MKTSTWTYVLGALMALYGLVGLVTGWNDQASAVGLIMAGLGVFGVTHQNVKLGRASNTVV